MEYFHNSVMADEVTEYLNINSNGFYVDCTLGGGGHSRLILEQNGPDGKLLALDRDQVAIDNAKTSLSRFKERLILKKANFSSLKTVMKEIGFEKADGILADIGVSSHHLDMAERGFSFLKEGPLDMRMDQHSEKTAYDIVNSYSSEELFIIFKKYGEEKFASRIANRIEQKRKICSIKTTAELADIIKNAIPEKFSRKSKIHPATKCFMAIRIEVNDELGHLEKFLEDAPDLLKPKARLCILTFHSLEDRIVKNKFKELENPCTCPPDFPVCMCQKKKEVRLVTRKPLVPGESEININPRARSTKMRVLEKL
ncbi:MAG: 16S rRNA (cytosine(1402)-N(4))-methyltransferase RsmH [Desulfobacteraceae bacterium]|nr:16S rRNA (cytosine(1402)-N(4))-methyltransferase RsmH [Desulfobacteraceae bacterium]MCB9494515.1 16S rRNA (cytosine(1402)-N(4))-methyltransferase RsmH [Desulfobacteraceae bacterium]